MNLDKDKGTFVASFAVPLDLAGGSAEVRSGPLALEAFHHLAGAYDETAKTVELFVDGSLVDSKPVQSSAPRSDRFEIGGPYCQDAPDNPYNCHAGVFIGQIDAIAISDQALKRDSFALKMK